ncbi:hypothetical protein L208DRAFT_1301593 [Tricholoma matsutake]|nr:hypothetical protein L208DRAFT_1301593 [Tricholoma matsutake 945]
MGKRPRGLLQFFQKGTKAHTSAYWAKQKELIGDQHENNKFNAEVNELQKKEDCRESTRARKQKQRAQEKESEIQTGVRTPGGRKRKMDLEDQASKKAKGNIAELTCPAHALKMKIKNKHRKPQGQKKKHQEKPAKHHNWHTPFCWSQILLAVKEVGWRMGASDIICILKQRDADTFAGITHSTVNEWIDQKGRSQHGQLPS